jgi:hypothetical protein
MSVVLTIQKHKYSCYSCGSNTTYIRPSYSRTKKPTEMWTFNVDKDDKIIGCLCKKCYDHFFKNRPNLKEVNRNYQERCIDYLGLHILLSFKLTRDKCEVCGASNCKIERHHYFYLRTMPWACTMQLCTKCHNKTKSSKWRGNR